MVFPEEFQQGEKLWVVLDLVKKDNRILIRVKILAVDRTQNKVEFLCGSDLLEQLRSFVIFHEIDFDEVLVQSFSYFAYYERLTHLPCSFQNQNPVSLGL